MKIKDLKLKNETDLQKLLAEKRERLLNLRFQVSSDQHKQVREIRDAKKTIARILTLLNNKGLLKKKENSTLVDENK